MSAAALVAAAGGARGLPVHGAAHGHAHYAQPHPTAAHTAQAHAQAAAQAAQAAVQVTTRPIQSGDVVEEKRAAASGGAVGLIGRFSVGDFLGKGGFASVHLMTALPFDAKLLPADAHGQLPRDAVTPGRVLAGKIIPKTSLAKESARKKLVNEIKIHRSLTHPNIVRFERHFEDKQNVYILLEVCANQTMMELVKRRKRLTEPEAQFYFWQLIDTVAYLHSQKVIHRDLKLGNLFLDANLNIKLGDFGLATKLEYDEERKKTICGTPNYIAPEILSGPNGHSYEVDIWSMGVILYTWLIGKPPFEATSVKSTYKRIRDLHYSFPDTIRISTAATALITRILDAKPENRPTLAEMRAHSFFSQSPIPKSLPQSVLTLPLEWPHRSYPTSNTVAAAANVAARGVIAMPVASAAGAAGAAGAAMPLQSSSAHNSNALKPSGLYHPNVPEAHTKSAKADAAKVVATSIAPGRLSGPSRHSGEGLNAAADLRRRAASQAPAVPSAADKENAGAANGQSQPQAQPQRKSTRSAAATLAPPGGAVIAALPSNSGLPSAPKHSLAAAPAAVPTASAAPAAAPAMRSTRSRAATTTAASTAPAPAIAQAPIAMVPVPAPKPAPAQPIAQPTAQPSAASVAAKPLPPIRTRTSGEGVAASAAAAVSQAANAAAALEQALTGLRIKDDVKAAQPAPAPVPAASAPASAPVAAPPLQRTASSASSSDAADIGAAAASHAVATAAKLQAPAGDVGLPAEDIAHLQELRRNMRRRAEKERAEEEALRRCHDVIEQSFCASKKPKASSKSAKPTAAPVPAAVSAPGAANALPNVVPDVTVVSWIDYSSKYGTGYLLSNGNAGVYFNDGTKAVLHADQSTFEYVGSALAPAPAPHPQGGATNGVAITTHGITRTRYSLRAYPQELHKKVTLLKHFVSYLHKPKADAATGGAANGAAAGAGAGLGSGSSGSSGSGGSGSGGSGGSVAGSALPAPSPFGPDDSGLVFVKKWVLTRHAILFVLSNNTVQVVFYDHTELVLWRDEQFVTYRNRNKLRTTYAMKPGAAHAFPDRDIAKRLNYAKDMLAHLVGAAAPAPAATTATSTAAASKSARTAAP